MRTAQCEKEVKKYLINTSISELKRGDEAGRVREVPELPAGTDRLSFVDWTRAARPPWPPADGMRHGSISMSICGR